MVNLNLYIWIHILTAELPRSFFSKVVQNPRRNDACVRSKKGELQGTLLKGKIHEKHILHTLFVSYGALGILLVLCQAKWKKRYKSRSRWTSPINPTSMKGRLQVSVGQTVNKILQNFQSSNQGIQSADSNVIFHEISKKRFDTIGSTRSNGVLGVHLGSGLSFASKDPRESISRQWSSLRDPVTLEIFTVLLILSL